MTLHCIRLLLPVIVLAFMAGGAAGSVAGAAGPLPDPTPVVTPTPGTGSGSLPVPTPSILPAPTPDGNPAPNPAGGTTLSFLPDPKEWAADVFQQVLVNMVQGLSAGLHQTVEHVVQSPLNFISQTPPAGSYRSPTVQALWNAVRAIADAALVLIVLWGGFNLMAREHLGVPYDSIMELLPRVIIAALLANTSLVWMGLVIDANNALCSAIGQVALPGWQQAATGTQVLVDVVAILIYLITCLLLLLQMLMRMALLDVLIVVAPLGVLCWILPQTRGWAQLWFRTFFTAVFVQFLQVLALKLGAALITDLTPLLAQSALLAVLIGMALLVLTMQLPGIVGRVGGGSGTVRTVLALASSATLRHAAGNASAAGAGFQTGGRP